MRAILFMSMILVAGIAMAQSEKAIIHVNAWPRVLNLPDKQIINPSVTECVTAGYRLLQAKSDTPAGKRIKSEKIIQDPDDPTKCKYEIAYEDIPVVVTPPPEVLTNIPASKVTFKFTTNGVFRGVVWVDAPKTNAVK